MNREILFKAKRKDNGEWIQGYYYQIWQQGYILWGMINNMPDMVEVNPDTLCQCTGLTDERGQKIWENDICNRKEKYPEIVTYNKGDWQLDYWNTGEGREVIIMQKWEEIEQKKEYLKGYIKAKNREALIKDQIQQLRLDTMFPALQGDGMPRGSSQKDLSDYTAKIESLMEELKKEWVESVIRYERIRKAINKMNDEQEKEALTRYYILREKWKEIKNKMGVSEAKLYRIYDRALENFEIL